MVTRAPQSVLVVGAGIVGAACAEALAEAGLRVTVLEAARPAGGATAAGMGHILVLDDSEAQLALTRLSRALWDARAWPAPVERDPCGTLWLAEHDAELEAARQKHGWYAERGVETELLGGARLRQLEPALRPGLAGALRIPGDSVVYPPAAAQAMLDAAARAGARVEHGVAVRTARSGACELADGSRREADVVLVAAGVATPALVDVPGLVVRPKKGHLAITDRCPGLVRHQLIELGYLHSAHGRERASVAFNVQPRRTGQLLLGSSRQLDDDDSVVDHAILARMVARGVELLPALADLPVVRCWTGLRPSTDDNLPVVGPVVGAAGEDAGLWLATGHEGVGITTSLGTARLVCDQLLGKVPPIDPAPYLPARLQQAERAHG